MWLFVAHARAVLLVVLVVLSGIGVMAVWPLSPLLVVLHGIT